MIEIKIKPLSVNEAWKGVRYKTDAYRKYERAVLFMLPKKTIENKPLKVELIFGFSSNASDLDNPVKLILDILQKKYKINDKAIWQLNIQKEIVKKGSEFFKFSISYI